MLRYVELNPVLAGMVDDPTKYRWSSCPAKVDCSQKTWLYLDPFYLSLGTSAAERAENYAAWLRESTPDSELKLIRDATQQGRLTAGEKFVREIADKIDRRLDLRKQGRPRKDEK